MSIYKSQKGRERLLELYDRQLLKSGKSFSDIYVQTSFGKTHIVEIGNSKETPLLVFHGGNSWTHAVRNLAHSLLFSTYSNKKGKCEANVLPENISAV